MKLLLKRISFRYFLLFIFFNFSIYQKLELDKSDLTQQLTKRKSHEKNQFLKVSLKFGFWNLNLICR